MRGLASVAAVVALVWAGGAAPASGQGATTVVADGVTLAPSASCRYGDIDIAYRAQAAQEQAMAFTSVGGTVLDQFEAAAFRADYAGVEHMLTEADVVPAAGATVGVYASVGALPPGPQTTSEFFVLYTCDSRPSSDGGVNRVLYTCSGAYGMCPQTADAALAAMGPVIRPTFTG